MRRPALRAHPLAVDTGVLTAQSSTVDTRAIEAHFSAMVHERVAEVNAAAVDAVLALDEAHAHLVSARIMAVAPPSKRWDCLLDQFRSKVAAPKSALADPLPDVAEDANRFARDLLVAAAAFLAAESNDVEDRISLLTTAGSQQDEIRGRLHDIADEVGDAAGDLIGRVEEGRLEFSYNIRSNSDSSQFPEGQQLTRPRHMQAVGKAAWSAAVGSIGVVITLFGESFRRNAPLTMVIMVSVVLLLCIGVLLGASWTTQALQPKLRRQAEERRRLNAEWSAIQTTRQQRRECTRCGPSGGDWYFAQTVGEELLYDND